MDAEGQQNFREFLANRSSALLRTAVLLSGGDQHAGEDLLQSALLKVVGRWNRIDDHEAYIRRILYRQQVNRWRLKWPRREVMVAEPPERKVAGDAHATAELRLVLMAALTRLTARQRSVLVLRYFEDLPEAEVARLLGCTVGTVRSTTHRALARLRSRSPELVVLTGGEPGWARRQDPPGGSPSGPRPPDPAAPQETRRTGGTTYAEASP
ncbi:SigE family RNA polymerase sigma factor [Streptomyces uncialis]|uniref:SigE family RNA polymerase sigma factor n=1 Tax=Streptomyces uncialis TaxID=1048205 RepID=UPI00340EB8AA